MPPMALVPEGTGFRHRDRHWQEMRDERRTSSEETSHGRGPPRRGRRASVRLWRADWNRKMNSTWSLKGQAARWRAQVAQGEERVEFFGPMRAGTGGLDCNHPRAAWRPR